MTDFYEPVQLFRQNALRLTKSGEGMRQQYIQSNFAGNSWSLSGNSSKDLLITNKTVGNRSDNDKMSSSYWKVGTGLEEGQFVTSVDSVTSGNSHVLAIGSGGPKSNLFIYRLGQDANEDFLLTHQKTITLPNIHSLKWLNPVDEEDDRRFLLSGHTQGTVNLTMIPEFDNGSASIVKRFNHAKHLEYQFPAHGTTIDNLMTTPLSWRSCTLNSILSGYSGNIFLWDSSRSSVPVVKLKIKGLSYFDASLAHESMLALAGGFGISLLDLRSDKREFHRPGESTGAACRVRWCGSANENLVASAHLDNTVQIWDIRNSETPLSSLVGGHKDQITSLEWDGECVITGSRDGTIVNWDTQFNTSVVGQKCTLRQGASSVFLKTDKDGQIVEDKEQYTNVRQCGTPIPASNTSIVALAQLTHPEKNWVVSIDEASFLGIHGKRSSTTEEDPTTPVDTLNEFELPLPETRLEEITFLNRSSSTLVEEDNLSTSKPPTTPPLKIHKTIERKTSESTLIEFVKEQNIPVTMFHNLPYI
ncbi:unnamed protein product [Kuraishia capsulata CBS 1993]|uniref:Uncharacterized protein n=1 Tax=Kuraishia capsulata CBS 1993 TaxID=1382522 RepID=W6MWF4_9ASCO|nr:uncharacterized protein KUCA_T00003328001 [Kuraishia capsulata CBS 1993]CDK27350.1 unnamed protein product [Kuraishia capsulata CBS 1993]